MGFQVTLPRETKEFLPLDVEANGAPASTFETAVQRWPARPTSWAPAVLVDGVPGVVVEGLTPGTWTVYVRLTTAQEEPVIYAGEIQVR